MRGGGVITRRELLKLMTGAIAGVFVKSSGVVDGIAQFVRVDASAPFDRGGCYSTYCDPDWKWEGFRAGRLVVESSAGTTCDCHLPIEERVHCRWIPLDPGCTCGECPDCTDALRDGWGIPLPELVLVVETHGD